MIESLLSNYLLEVSIAGSLAVGSVITTFWAKVRNNSSEIKAINQTLHGEQSAQGFIEESERERQDLMSEVQELDRKTAVISERTQNIEKKIDQLLEE